MPWPQSSTSSQGWGGSKNLADAARFWAGDRDDEEDDSGITQSIVDELVLSRAPPHVIADMQARVKAKPDPESFEVWPDCWEAVEFFRSLRGQWNHVSGMAIARVGLNFTAVESAMKLDGIRKRDRKRLFDDMKVMEQAVLAADRAIADKKKDDK